MENILDTYTSTGPNAVNVWYEIGLAAKIPDNGGVCIKYKELQIAVFNYTRLGKWYACQNLCPHKMEMVISRGMIGETEEGLAKVACALHKQNFSLEDGDCLTSDLPALATYPVKVEGGRVFVGFEN